MKEQRSESDYVGTQWRDKGSHALYTVISQTGRSNATPQNVSDAILVLKTTSLRAQRFVTLTVSALSAEFSHVSRVDPSADSQTAEETGTE